MKDNEIDIKASCFWKFCFTAKMVCKVDTEFFIVVRFYACVSGEKREPWNYAVELISFLDDRTGTDYNFKIVVKMHEFSRRRQWRRCESSGKKDKHSDVIANLRNNKIYKNRENDEMISYCLEKHGKPVILRNFFCTWINQRIFMEFY